MLLVPTGTLLPKICRCQKKTTFTTAFPAKEAANAGAGDLQVSQSAHEVQDVAQVRFGIFATARRLSKAQPLGDGVELQRAHHEHVPVLQQLLPCSGAQ